MNNTIKSVNKMNLDSDADDPLELFNKIAAAYDEMKTFTRNHCITTVGSTFTQFIAMSVLLEGRSGKSHYIRLSTIGQRGMYPNLPSSDIALT